MNVSLITNGYLIAGVTGVAAGLAGIALLLLVKKIAKAALSKIGNLFASKTVVIIESKNTSNQREAKPQDEAKTEVIPSRYSNVNYVVTRGEGALRESQFQRLCEMFLPSKAEKKSTFL